MGNPVPVALLNRFNRVAAEQGVETLASLDRPDREGMDGTWLLLAINSVLRPEYRSATTVNGFAISVHPDIAPIVQAHLGAVGEPVSHGGFFGPCTDLYAALVAAV